MLAVEEEGGDVWDMVVLHIVCDGALGDLWEGVCVGGWGEGEGGGGRWRWRGYLRCERVRGDG